MRPRAVSARVVSKQTSFPATPKGNHERSPVPFRGQPGRHRPSRFAWQSRAREVEDLGYDTLQVPDHLGMPAPFPALVVAAEATSIRLGTYVLNVGVVSPAYLARDVADTCRLTDGRFELGLGAGYLPAEFEAADLPFGTPGSRLRRLEQVITQTRELLAAEPDAPRPPVMLAGAGNRILTLAAHTADIVSFPVTAGMGPGGPEQALGHPGSARPGRCRRADRRS